VDEVPQRIDVVGLFEVAEDHRRHREMRVTSLRFLFVMATLQTFARRRRHVHACVEWRSAPFHYNAAKAGLPTSRMTSPHASNDDVSLDAATGVLTDVRPDENEKSISSHQESQAYEFASYRLGRG
jgi:hypothetical protein